MDQWTSQHSKDHQLHPPRPRPHCQIVNACTTVCCGPILCTIIEYIIAPAISAIAILLAIILSRGSAFFLIIALPAITLWPDSALFPDSAPFPSITLPGIASLPRMALFLAITHPGIASLPGIALFLAITHPGIVSAVIVFSAMIFALTSDITVACTWTACVSIAHVSTACSSTVSTPTLHLLSDCIFPYTSSPCAASHVASTASITVGGVPRPSPAFDSTAGACVDTQSSVPSNANALGPGVGAIANDRFALGIPYSVFAVAGGDVYNG
ncbi:hypothetical protein C1H76_2715 [Elsinoe australis]|uniref:Uncharacterized protein n=1 Tax=Elsinoe australis TaxID=40998 RepID=A0A4U7B2M0_9PEZI|nr:hypothetical protein C1H76_2715 [Elsinoe australis]